MSRTEELRRGGAKDHSSGSGGGAPFVKWGDQYSYVEGSVLKVWEGKFGFSATIRVADCGGREGPPSYAGKNEDGQKISGSVENGMELNVGLNYAAMEDAIEEIKKGGGYFHFAFEGWQDTKDGSNKYRVFTVLEDLPKEDRAQPGRNVEGYDPDHNEPDDDSGLPF